MLGFERERVTVHGAERLSSIDSVRLMPVGGVVEALRITKDPSEVASIRAAAALALDAFESVIPSLRAGESELAVASRLEAALRVRGSEWHPFQTIVASGPNSALPHARAGARTVQPGELLLLDFGAQLDGYCADLTRTVVIGQADGRQREVYDAVRTAQRAAMTGMRAGMPGREADALARRSLEERGLAAEFRHSLGHGLGLEVHEDPRVSPMVEAPLPAGAVVTVEPGVYFEGWGGVRLEDDVLLTSEGPEWLSPGAPELLEVP
jgi:Xaa-Pro aminopeptidase